MVDDRYARLFELLGELRVEIEHVNDVENIDEQLSLALDRLAVEVTTTGNRVVQLRPELVGQLQVPVQ